MDRELANIEFHRRGVTTASDPRLKSLFSRLVDAHKDNYTELESYLRELQSLNEITRQINEMFL